MEDEVVYISDDDEVEEERATAASEVPRPPFYHCNTYEYYDTASLTPPSREAGVGPDDIDVGSLSLNEVVVVLDDEEINNLIIGPIQRISRQILFSGLELSPEFPHELLIELEQHLTENLRRVLVEGEANVWNITLEQLAIVKMAYSHMDVS